MDSRIETQLPNSVPKRRQQRYLHFKLQPGDEALLNSLSEKQRNLLLAEGSYKETAALFGLPIGTVRSRLHRARATLEHLRQSQIDQSSSDKSGSLN